MNKKLLIFTIITVLIMGALCGCACGLQNTNTNPTITTQGIETGLVVNDIPVKLGHTIGEYKQDYPKYDITSQKMSDGRTLLMCNLKTQNNFLVIASAYKTDGISENDTEVKTLMTQLNDSTQNVNIHIGEDIITKDTKLSSIEEIFKKNGGVSLGKDSYSFNNIKYTFTSTLGEIYVEITVNE